MGVITAYALALQLVLGGFAASAKADAPGTAAGVLCHALGGNAAGDDPGAPDPGNTKHLCQICCLAFAGTIAATPPGIAVPFATEARMLRPAAQAHTEVARPHSPHRARAPPHMA